MTSAKVRHLNVDCCLVNAENENIKAKQSQDLSRDSAGCTIWHVLGCGNMHTDVKEESDSGDESVHTTAVAA